MTARRLLAGCFVVLFVAIVSVATLAVVHVVDVRQTTDRNLTRIAVENHDNGDQIKAALAILNAATGPDAQARQEAVLGGAIDDIRRSINCVALYDMGLRPPACADVDARMDALVAGQDPFARKGP